MEVGRARRNRRIFEACCIPPLFQQQQGSNSGQLFLGATTEFCWPSRVRTDKGGENAEVARLMVEKRGEGRGSILQGSSVHREAVERHGAFFLY